MNLTCCHGRGLALILAGLLVLPAVLAADQGQAPRIEIVDVTGAAMLGREDAPATLVIFADLGAVTAGGLGSSCTASSSATPRRCECAFGTSPAADQPDRVLAHRAALAAGEQGKFWEMVDLLLANRARLGSEQLLAMAAQLALDTTRFSEDIDSVAVHQRIDVDRQQAASLKLGVTPVFFVNGVRLTGPKSLTELAAQIDAAIAGTRGAGFANR